MIPTHNQLTDVLTPLLAQDDPGRLVSFALACAAFVLPLYELYAPDDTRLRCALHRNRQAADLQRAEAAWRALQDVEGAAIAYYAAMAVVNATRLARGLRTSPVNHEPFVDMVYYCVRWAGRAVCLVLETGSAQERLDLLGRMEGHASFEAMLVAWLVEPDPLWQDRLASRTLDLA